MIESFTIQLDDLRMTTNPILPTYEAVLRGARIHALAFAMMQEHGNITKAAELLKTSRRVVREWIQEYELYPWPGDVYTPLDLAALLTPPVFENAGVVEDGRRGQVTVKDEMVDHNGALVGPAFLIRGEEAERMWPGRWVTWHRAHTYAMRNGHTF